MVRYMADSTVCSQIPKSVNVPGTGVVQVALRCGYLGGSYEKSSHACGPVDVNIDVDATHPQADVLDIEVGDATPDAAPGWVKRHNALGSFPAILYCNRSTMSAVANYCQAAGLLPGRDYFWWIATLNGVTSVADMTGVLAVQAWGANFFPGHNIDLSVVYNDAWKSGGDVPLTQQDVDAIWKNEFVKRGGVPDNPAIQELADTKSLGLANAQALASLQGQVAGLVNAVQQLASNISGGVDLTAVHDAAKQGAEEALAAVDIVVQPKPAT